jgi:hypothetical protein
VASFRNLLPSGVSCPARAECYANGFSPVFTTTLQPCRSPQGAGLHACRLVAARTHLGAYRYRGMFRIRVKTGHKNTAEGVRPGKTTACMVAQVGSHSPRSSIRAEAGVRKRFCQSVIQQAVFTRMKLNRSSVREGLLFWTDFPMAGFYTYPELTHTNTSSR